MTPEPTHLDFTVAICTYNGASRLPDLLDCLRWQLNASSIRWEIIVVNNNSTDRTAEVVHRYQKNWPCLTPLRYAFEPEQGAGYARQKAVTLAHSPWVGFLDDDNLPSMLWISKAYQFAQQSPSVGAFGSRIRGEFDSVTPPNFGRIASFMALTDRGDHPLPYVPAEKVLPPGAGLVVKREAWLNHVPTHFRLGIRVNHRDVAEDLEPLLYIQKAGWQIWYNPSLRLVHRIPGRRLTRQSLLSLMRGIGLSRHRTRMLSVCVWKRPIMFWAYALNDIRKIIRHVYRYGSGTWTDTVAACEMTLYCHSLISPYYLLHQKLQEILASYSQPQSLPDNVYR